MTASEELPVRSLALVMGGDLFEDFHDTIGVSLERFRTDLTGGWLFNYVEALATAGTRTTLIHASARVTSTQRFTHEPTGVAVTILPAPRRHRVLRAAYRRSKVRKSLSSLASYGSIPVLALVRELRRCRAEAILTQEYEHARTDVLVVLGALTRLPVFATFQGGDAPRSRLERAVRPWAVRRCAGLIVGSASERRRLESAYGVRRDRIADVPNAIEVTSHQPMERVAARRLLAIPAAARVVEWHGRITIRRKGLDVLVAAWEQVVRARPDQDLLLLLVGTGEDAAELHRRIAATGLGSIRWRDEYLSDRAALLPYPSAADIFVLPSRHEGFPVALLEAMAAGLAVVAADAPGVDDILPDGERSGGVVVPREDVDALAAALGRLIDDPQLTEELGRRARDRAERHYAYQVVGAQLRHVLFDQADRQT